MNRRLRALTAAAFAVVLTGCAGPLLPGVSGGPTATVSTAAVDLVAARKAAGIADCPPSSTKPAVKGGLPDVTLECLGGATTLRLGGLRGPMLINLWAQWCEPCRDEAPHLSAFARTQQKVAVLGIDYSDPQPALAIEFAQLTAMTYPHLADEENTLKGPLGVTGIPYTILIDADGRIVARHPGQFISLENVQDWVAKGLGE